MSQGKLSFKTTKQSRRGPIKNLDAGGLTNETVKNLRSTDVQSPGSKRKYASSPESSSPVAKPPKTGHTRVKREQKRVRHTRSSHTACKTLFDYVASDKTESTEKKQEADDVPESESGGTESHLAAPNSEETIPAELEPTVEPVQEEETENTSEEVTPSVSPEPVVCEDKSTQNDPLFSAKSFLKKMTVPREEPAEVKVAYKTNGGKMLAAALAKKKAGVPAHKNDVIRALAARKELCVRTPSLPSTCSTEPTSSRVVGEKSRDTTEKLMKVTEKLRARDRFAHLIKPASPKIKPFKSISISSPTKSPLKDVKELILPEMYKRLQDKFNTSDQVVNLLARRQETCTFQKLQRNVQEICRKRFTEGDLSTAVGVYTEAYILAQCKGLSQIKNDRTVRNEYQLTIAFNYQETEHIKKAQTTNIFGLHPTMDTKRVIQFEDEQGDSNKLSENEKISLSLQKEKHAFNQRGLVSAELLERSKRFQKRLLKFVHSAHQLFLSTLVPTIKIDPAKLTRWHPEFDLNGLELPPPADLPKPPVSSRLLSANEMLQQIDSNKALPPPGMQDAVDKNLQKVLSEKKQLDKKKEEQLKGINPALVARIRAKEAKRIAQQMTRDPQTDKELAMVERLEPIIRCLRVLYVSAGKGSLLLSDVTLDIASNPSMTMSQPAVEEHVRLLIKICPTWLSMASLRKKEYLKLNRNIDTNIVLDAVKNKHNQLMS
ncbi:DNA replication factor Cdt1-like [Bolinopsis microptera]|uniref:DNA replication factor Cdt1-like n=1 Tax=Bolinopsis microptera TaxID=2820187 RepID=UPI00307AE07F